MLSHLVQWRALRRALAIVLPIVIAFAYTSDPLWLLCALVATCSLVAADRSDLTALGTLVHGAITTIGWLSLLWAQHSPTIYLFLIVAYALLGALVGTRHPRLRAAALFALVPTLYVSSQIGDGLNSASISQVGHVISSLTLAVVPVVAWRSWRQITERQPLFRLTKFPMAETPRPADAYASWLAVTSVIGVLFAGLLVVSLPISHKHWLIWSALIVAADPSLSRAKMWARVIGGSLGAMSGEIMACYLPAASWVVAALSLGALLTLVAIKPYSLAFGLRSCMVVMGISLLDGEHHVALVRMVDVIAGSCIGYFGLILAAVVVGRVIRPSKDP